MTRPRGRSTRKKRVFISFDFDNDQKLKHAFVGQARLPESPFQIVDHSFKRAAPQLLWEMKARGAIARAEILVVLIGRHTRCASGVLKEIKIARELGKRVIQILPSTSKPAWRVPGGGQLYKWNWPNLEKLFR